ncbi:ArnT family glycosyltransferase [Aureliella helgolandensis]|uniref:Dolichyl-phosphate-mannose-protein mannosyltransferase n=1 Tax=Aureliella helgolandensis TaxID=2527968 RepID=A0A518GEK6_9BACT|nr:glycosyltransferase family 39 protein [Aureliella helgolandensis]QDV26988.1 Dolichyl-phosphate-mannose-protein mannosyltransferase [Aureliella helgolandensis]
MTPVQKKYFVALLVGACLVRIVAAVAWQPSGDTPEQLFRLGDSLSYWVLAEQLGQGLPYQYGSENARVFRAPLYPLLLTPCTWIPDARSAVFTARILGCLLGTLAVGLLFVLARRLGGTTAALWAATLGACYPSAIGMSIAVLSEALFMPLMVGNLLLWQSAWNSGTTRRAWSWSLAAGACAGLAILARPSWLLYTPFAAVVGWLWGPRRSRHLLVAAGTALGICLVMSPWWVRNASVTGKFVLTTLQVGPSLYDGWHPGATGASDEGMAFMGDMYAAQLAEDALTPQPLESTLEWRLNHRAQTAALRWAGQHPWEVVQLAGQKFQRTWSVWPGGGELGSLTSRLVLTLGCFTILLLAFVHSLQRFWQFDWLTAICWMPCLYFTALHMVFVGSIRYREPAMFALCALAGCAVAQQLGYSSRVAGTDIPSHPSELPSASPEREHG